MAGLCEFLDLIKARKPREPIRVTVISGLAILEAREKNGSRMRAIRGKINKT